MALRAILNSDEIASLSDIERGHYAKQDDGSHRLDVTEAGGFALTGGGLTRALEAERAARSESDRKFSAMETRFAEIDPDKYRTDLEDLTRLREVGEQDEAKVAEQRRQYEASLAESFRQKEVQMVEAHQATLVEKTARADSLQGQLDRQLVDNQARAAILAKDPKANAEFLMYRIRENVQAVDGPDGQRMVEVLGAMDPVSGKRNPRLFTGGDGAAVPMSISHYVEELHLDEKLGALWSAGDVAGSGAVTARPGTRKAQPNPFATASRNITEQARLKKEDSALYDRLKAEAAAVPAAS